MYQLPAHGLIQLEVPKAWQETVHRSKPGLPPTIEFSPRSGDTFKLLITPNFPTKPDANPPSPHQLYVHATKSAERLRPQLAEQQIPLRGLQGKDVVGYYFSGTDKAPKPGEFKYITQGVFTVGKLSPTFTLLRKEGADAVTEEALRMLGGARHVEKLP